MHTIKKQFAGKVKLIYIDPPYNTGNDGFKYNDSFNHSSWLTFMKNRLEIARELLRDDGVIFVSCDDRENAYLKVLMDEIFKKDDFLINIVWENKEGGGKSDSKHFRSKHEYILCYAQNKNQSIINPLDIEDADRYKLSDIHEAVRGKHQLIKLDSASLGYIESLDYPILSPDNQNIFPNKDNKKISRWRWSEEKLKWGIKNDFVVIKKDKNNIWQVYTKQYLKADNEGNLIDRKIQPTGVINKFSTTQSNKHIKSLFGSAIFKYSKPEELIKYLIEISTNPNDLVLDFFSGSGTTPAVAHKMNRRWIAIEQMNYIQDLPEARLKKVIAGEQGGISKSVKWQGGGSFVYFELATHNQKLIDEILATTNDKMLDLWQKIKKEGFLIWNVDIKKFDQNLDEFEKCTLEEKRKILMDILNMNMIYVLLGNCESDEYGFTKDEIELNKSFFQDQYIYTDR
jgi:adenine-specific DNA-methyltransferase